MGFVVQIPETVGGTVLIIERIESQNYVPGVSGWAIFADGSAEFNSVTARGAWIVGSFPGRHIRAYIDTTLPFTPIPTIELATGNANEALPATITTSGPLDLTLEADFTGPKHATGHQASIRLLSNGAPVTDSELSLNADFITVSTPMLYEQAWTALTFSGTWTDVAGARAGYFKDATGRVQLRGQVVGGAAAQIGVMPVGYRPKQTMEWIMRGAGGVILCAVSVDTNGLITATANAATAEASGVRLDSISYPTQF
ncbi:MAG TPA: hypothetical protein VGH54_15675 [Mycobacterium sp.]|jgi:hypothetical protein|uniref:hypothetical protein n=1 Tax=Mycobacterium sp. TaxID=1785 RepID=UPI002F3F52EF